MTRLSTMARPAEKTLAGALAGRGVGVWAVHQANENAPIKARARARVLFTRFASRRSCGGEVIFFVAADQRGGEIARP